MQDLVVVPIGEDGRWVRAVDRRLCGTLPGDGAGFVTRERFEGCGTSRFDEDMAWGYREENNGSVHEYPAESHDFQLHFSALKLEANCAKV